MTMLDLDSAVAEVERGLQVLDHGLDTIETDVFNGRLQLYGTGKVSSISPLRCDNFITDVNKIIVDLCYHRIQEFVRDGQFFYEILPRSK